ncbi:MAG: gliding motility lipoprotein GldH [Bacteroidales bacterium]|nr:gliding motility lipoprotein GldH [Bacteroidales bacterium]
MDKMPIPKIVVCFVMLIPLFFVSCTSNDVYFQYRTVAPGGWSKDSLYAYDVSITDAAANYNVYVNIRNRGEYPNQNLWLFIRKITPDSVMSNDTINFYLADQRGKWLGSGVGPVFEMPVLYQQNIRFPKVGTYRYEIFHGMRDSVLPGINDVGLRVEKVVK